MKIKLFDAVSLHNVVSQLNISCLDNDVEKLSLIRLTVRLKQYAQQWQDTVDTARTMAADQSNALLNKEAQTELEISDDLLISPESAEKLAVANTANLATGALTYILEYLVKS